MTTQELLTWLIPIPPLVAFFLIVLFTARSRALSTLLAVGSMVISAVLGFSVFFIGISTEHLGAHPIESAIDWLSVGAEAIKIGVVVDPLTVIMLFMVPLTATSIFVYSIGYMAADPRYSRFFAFISLFAGAMLTLVVADNLLLLFIGWEIMGLCSYLLIGFWFEKRSAYRAAVKAFLTTRVGDVLMLLGIAYLYSATGTLNFHEVLRNPEMLESLAAPSIYLGGGISTAGLIGLLLFAGTVGKSAQFPLHVWLPDAMEGPTPVSAMIHAATMVSAGVYMVIRMYPLLSIGAEPHEGIFSPPMLAMGLIGAFTALFSATIAVAQNDIKRVLAYSTISQLGYMVAALGIGAYIAAAFHLITHAIFKALLFMGSGSVIHGMEHGEHHAHHEGHHMPEGFNPQDMRFMGGLRKKQPITFWTFLIGGMALSGFPVVTAGFWSKDEIIADALQQTQMGHGLGVFVFVMLVAAAFLTAFYTMRQIGMTFFGKPRSAAAEHATESVWTMTAPLVVLAFFALVTGFVGVHPDFPILGAILSPGESSPFHEFVGGTLLEHPEALPFNPTAVATSVVVALGGLALGWWVYVVRGYKEATQPDPVQGVLGGWLYSILVNKYYFDELYEAIFIKPAEWFAEKVAYLFIDRGIIDGILHGIGRIAIWIGYLFRSFNTEVVDGVGDGIPMGIGEFGAWFREIQTGKIQQYLLMALVSIIVIGAIFWFGG